ncbi:hypothetical protein N878_00755 [Pseudomonas sp. EGD-AK9]|nr:hypothetical protein N878_00755 [Pseudomonas sp. EGD-AK9]
MDLGKAHQDAGKIGFSEGRIGAQLPDIGTGTE